MAQRLSGLDVILAQAQVYPCVLLVHTDVATLAQAAAHVEAQYGWPRLPVGLALSQALLDVPPRHRPRQAARFLRDAVTRLSPGPVLWVDVDLLFEPSLALDPLALARECSRVVPAVMLWPGAFVDGVLSYAVPAHAHYRTWRRTELGDRCIVPL